MKSEVVNKPLYVMVIDDDDDNNNNDDIHDGGDDKKVDMKRRREPYRYMRSTLQSTLQLMGCKPRHAFKISQRVFELIRGEQCTELLYQEGILTSGLNASRGHADRTYGTLVHSSPRKLEMNNNLASENNENNEHMPYETYKKRTTVSVRRETFLNVVCKALAEYKYVGPNQWADLVLACRIRERKESLTVLLCGTSGCGKSTLSALLASRLGITTVISTDSIRHMMRSFVDEKESPLLWASTYHAGEYLDPEAVAEAKARRKAKKLAGVSSSRDGSGVDKSFGPSSNSNTAEIISPKEMAIEGYKAQSEMVIESLDRLITGWEERKESVVVEGVHLSLNFVMGLMKKHPSIVPFMIYISNEEKHLERFAVRAKYMTLDPEKNKYVKYIRNIRTIQEYLCKQADKNLVPKINNTNVDKSVAAIHATVFSCLRRRAAGDQLYDPIRNMVTVVDEEYRSQCTANSFTSKGVFQLIQRKGSSRNLMALLNYDGSIAKAWPIESVHRSGGPTVFHSYNNGVPMYGKLKIGKAEPVNLQFGHFGISAWPSDGSTSHAGSYDESKADWDLSSRQFSSCGSSPKLPDGLSKELKEDNSVHGSDDEVDDPPEEGDSEFSDDGDDARQVDDEVGSVDEESTKSDEEYDDLAMMDVQHAGYWTDEEFKDKLAPLWSTQSSHMRTETHGPNIHRLLRTRSEQMPKALCPPYPSLEHKEGLASPSWPSHISEGGVMLSHFKHRRRAKSIPSFGRHGSVHNIAISPGLSRS